MPKRLDGHVHRMVEFINCLSDRDRLILNERYGRHRYQKEVAFLLHLSMVRLVQIDRKLIKRIEEIFNSVK